MSFLNPVSEPVLVFSSNDANAPQINTTRAAGDTKTIWKACLVTGYGSKASAGWTMQNETVTAAEFVSPSAAMSNYKLGIDEATNARFALYYTVAGTKYNLSYMTNINKAPSYINAAKNGWYLLVTNQGFYFIETFFNTYANKMVGRVSYLGAIKHALNTDNNKNIGGFTVGYGAVANDPRDAFKSNRGYLTLNTYTSASFAITNIDMLSGASIQRSASVLELTSGIYYHNAGTFIGEQPGMLLQALNDDNKVLDVYQTTFDNRPVLFVCLGVEQSSATAVAKNSVASLIYLDNWGY